MVVLLAPRRRPPGQVLQQHSVYGWEVEGTCEDAFGGRLFWSAVGLDGRPRLHAQRDAFRRFQQTVGALQPLQGQQH